ncbi:FtsB family cell division protein [Paenirhodobacter populi]|uniref:Septum formation initiator family protein n=1 Tax=Paenirhodobacter populi TaxID=2306993 RepID=A0A443JVR2_9RHOB|nr:septum formation initiator family protein [Sinirhodobacter populi]RWR07656.1 septum formation initiator family protein [Sinirhodobacter populi]RWR13391.1 septum formation initiator family protein [Sinirhodobacter populi]RWR24607.1 septum formation initiator family protein [Sinirhodobacter populi]RWR29545.1 septum formation initiator family protein [Sinirhodobacter populi]RWR30726.1 septum formation initiator family protein [Sinirhodobacter populi]
MFRKNWSIGPLIFFFLAFILGAYFTFAAVQGSYGILRRVQIDAEIETLTTERNALRTEAERMANLTRRLSDDYLDLDLLDERAREVLGTVRPDEIVIR